MLFLCKAIEVNSMGIMTSSYIKRLLDFFSTEYIEGGYLRPPEEEIVAVQEMLSVDNVIKHL